MKTHDSLAAIVSRLLPFFWFALAALLLLSLSRLGLAIWHADQVSAVDGWARVLGQGVRVDVASVCLLYGGAAVLYLLLPDAVARSRVVRMLFGVWLVGGFAVLAMLELSTPAFMQEYGLRPDRLFVEYLIYPREVASTLLKGHAASVLVTVVVMAVLAVAGGKLARRVFGRVSLGAGWLRLPVAVAVLLLCALGVRSTLGHRPMNPAMIAFSSDPTVNVLPLNSFYSVSHAVRDWLRQQDGAEIYGLLPDDEVIATVRAGTGLPTTAFVSDAIPSLASRPASHSGRPRNLVIVLEESLGAQFIGSLGGLPLSPNYDRLSQQGWALERLYATGTRSVRGIEAVLTGFTPTPAQAVVKLPGSQKNFFTLAEVLRRRGYDTTFYYGGESHFDNMRGFFFGNGFTRVIDQNDYPAPDFVGSWGVSDEDLFERADAEFRALHAAGKPFFGLVFSSSNHDPFEFPDGRIELYEQPKQTRNNAAKYADHALGRFFDRAMAAPYWHDTVFLVVADHDSRVIGRNLVPIANFHIPGLILGADIAPRRDDRLISQIDLAPTLLSLIGVDDPTPMTGMDLTRADASQPGRAMMQYDRNYAWMQGGDVLILQPGKEPAQYRYDRDTERLLPAELSPELARRAHAHALWGSLAYSRGWFRLPALDATEPDAGSGLVAESAERR